MRESELFALCEARSRANPEAAWLRRRVAETEGHRLVEKFLEQESWPHQAMAATVLGVDRATIHRMVKKGDLMTNGAEGRDCRIDPVSLLHTLLERLDKCRRRQVLGI